MAAPTDPYYTPAHQAALQSAGSRAVQAIAYAAAITPSAGSVDQVVNVGTLTGNITINAPTGSPVDGQVMRLRLAQDATGGRVITWDPAFAFGTDVTAALIPTAANAKWVMLFAWDATSSKWRALSIARGF